MSELQIGDRVQIVGKSQGVSQDRKFNKSFGTVEKIEGDEIYVTHEVGTGGLGDFGGYGIWREANVKFVSRPEAPAPAPEIKREYGAFQAAFAEATAGIAEATAAGMRGTLDHLTMDRLIEPYAAYGILTEQIEEAINALREKLRAEAQQRLLAVYDARGGR
jgi:hypothetical protein